MSAPMKLIAIPLPVTPAARSSIAPAKEPRPDLPPPFKYRSLDVTRKELLDARHVEPFTLLPRIFIPVPRGTWKPPVMHYGWPAPRQRLLAYAEAHGLTLLTERRNPKIFAEECDYDSDLEASESDTDDDDTDDADTDDAETDEATEECTEDDTANVSNANPSCDEDIESDGSGTVAAAKSVKAGQSVPRTRKRGPRGDVDEFPTVIRAATHILTEAGAPAPRTISITSTLQHGGGERFILSVYTNYHFLRKDVPSPEDVQRIAKTWRINTPPKWYIDDTEYDWRPLRDP